jgi:hypothetical protein
MNDQFKEFSHTLPLELLQRAYRSRHELAWARADAVEAIDRLEKAGFRLLGVEVSPGPKMTGWFWDSNDKETARDFVKGFKWGQQDGSLKKCEPFFNLTVAERQT